MVSAILVGQSLTELVSGFSCVGVSGSRALPAQSVAVLRWLLARLSPSCLLITGCARGADAVAREVAPEAMIFHADVSLGRGGFAARSVAVVRAVEERSGLWVCFPASSCPSGLSPSRSSSRCFSGSGSGSWASAAYAAGLGLPVLVWLPEGLGVPTWGFEALGRGWFLRRNESENVQISLF
jgi:hypothetical protein